MKPCSRCVLTTVSTEHCLKHPNAEPLRTLQEFRTADNGDIDFGHNMIACNSRIICVGDTVEVLSTKPPSAYGAGNLEASLLSPQDNVHNVTIEYKGQIFTGNSQQILFEQPGIRVPYSCWAGICGSCRITLVSGEVAQLKKSTLARNSSIFCCSCVPKRDVTLA